jgi:hypothetical protein
MLGGSRGVTFELGCHLVLFEVWLCSWTIDMSKVVDW